MVLPRDPRSHVVLPAALTSTHDFRSANRGGRSKQIPPRSPADHAFDLRQDFRSVRAELSFVAARQQDADLGDGVGIAVRFASFPHVDLALDSLDLKSHGIELLNVKERPTGEMLASVWIPAGKLEVFEEKVAAYLDSSRDSGVATKHQRLIDAIDEIRSAVLEDLWTDEAAMPKQDVVSSFEVWLSTPAREMPFTRGFRIQTASERVQRFRLNATLGGMVVGKHVTQFPERAVLHVRGTLEQMRSSVHLLGQLAEFRFAPETADFFMRQKPDEQREWSAELLARTKFLPQLSAPHICILDTGCASAHPLLVTSLNQADMYTVDPAWSIFDTHGHGSQQAGLALWGDIAPALDSSSQIEIRHRLETVKLLDRDDSNLEEHLAPLTARAVSLPEISFPFRSRLFSMAVTCTNTTVRGKPSAWSAELDALASDWLGDGESPRLFIISAGNVFHDRRGGYISLNSATSVEDPAQSWNAISVGALTRKTSILEDGADEYVPLAEVGQLSPFSSTSLTWQSDRPFKPDVVFEGGNMGDDGSLISEFDSLRLLTTHHLPASAHFATTFATSAATALASRFAAQVMVNYPHYWPETVRAVIVHSANWTDGLVRQFPATDASQMINRLRHCGWGEPDLDQAIHSGADTLTLVFQGRLQPFYRKPRIKKADGKMTGGYISAHQMHLHQLPWPTEALQGLMNLPVELRITLSYFIEPNPGERGRGNRFSYSSHGLRFAVQSATESKSAFERRINRLAEEGDPEDEGAEDRGWLLGMRKRFRGSIHHDRLASRAVDMATRSYVAVYPVGGWWKTREAQERFERDARYSLIVSLHAPELSADVDLYAALLREIDALVATENLV